MERDPEPRTATEPMRVGRGAELGQSRERCQGHGWDWGSGNWRRRSSEGLEATRDWREEGDEGRRGGGSALGSGRYWFWVCAA